ncbi:RNA polymerase subunit sigma-24 [Devosia sp. Root436]|uniref:RNA polymerase sigma factor n=1 Tax=Devosia sp. Root436 TaxID=1736537 RepID=UPI0006FC7B2E|nr:RNA polymerase sigma factor [Devosia sp. Root436]KQX35259.1 RNA polymerase subunit sigma-24 [Devosia sp. Root436]
MNDARAAIEAVYRAEAPRVLATLIRLLGGFERAEEALHDAWLAALDSWPERGVPDNPRAWLVSAGRFKAIDRIRREARFNAASAELEQQIELAALPEDNDAPAIADDQLRLIFTCCHPALAPDAQVALTLREICGLTTEEIATAYLTKPVTIAQRIVRAKAKIRDAGIPYAVPGPAELPDRIETVLQVIYLVFNEGYLASSGATPLRTDLCAEAIRLARLLGKLIEEPEATGLLALMLLHDARRAARVADGEIVPLDEQDRTLWNHAQIAEGQMLVRQVLAGRFSLYSVQAAIAACHTAGGSDWPRIVALYDLLVRIDPSPIVDLNRAVAVAMRDGPETGLALIDGLEMNDYRLWHAARADLLRRLGRMDEARNAYEAALAMTTQEAERRFIGRRLRALKS